MGFAPPYCDHAGNPLSGAHCHVTEQRERRLRGDLYLADDPVLLEERARAQRLLDRFNSTGVDHPDARRALLTELLESFGAGAEILPPLRCDYGYTTSVGVRTFINYGAVILDPAYVRIGADVQIGPNVQLLTATHPIDAATRRERWESADRITIEDGAWLGGGVIVCPGVTIGADAVIGAGSVVTRDIPRGVVAMGNPCRVIRDV
jgi:maltose O-acetyltransferase